MVGWAQSRKRFFIKAEICVLVYQAQVVSKIAHTDWPETWPALLDSLLANLRSGEPSRVHGTMRVLVEFMKSDITDQQFPHIHPVLFPELYRVLCTENVSIKQGVSICASVAHLPFLQPDVLSSNPWPCCRYFPVVGRDAGPGQAGVPGSTKTLLEAVAANLDGGVSKDYHESRGYGHRRAGSSTRDRQGWSLSILLNTWAPINQIFFFHRRSRNWQTLSLGFSGLTWLNLPHS